MVTVLSPSNTIDYDPLFRRLVASGTLPPFDQVLVDFVDAVSKSVLLDPAMRSMPEMMAVAYWMRKSHIMKLRRDFEGRCGNRIVLPRGVALHFAPSNVDSIFVYSWFISLLLGNANVIRLSSRRGTQVDTLLATINAISAQERFQDIRIRNLILSYEHDDALTQRLSETCHVRLLWGGDESVRRLRSVPMNTLAIEVAFANRFSLAVLNAATVANCDAEAIKSLAGRFFNDAYWFDQMACSAPRLVAWVGDAGVCSSAQNVFWPALGREVDKHGTQYAEMVGLNKQVAAYVLAAAGTADKILPGITGPISRVHLTKDPEGQFRSIECGGGLFFEMEISRLEELTRLLTARDQTLSYFGFDPEALKRFACTLPTRAIDRIVPIGMALEFSTVWDGYDLFQILSREVDLL
jgi:acyl-CoA reductase LuxC